MDTVSVSAHFDGERILLDEPFELEPNTRLIVTILPKQNFLFLGGSELKVPQNWGI